MDGHRRWRASQLLQPDILACAYSAGPPAPLADAPQGILRLGADFTPEQLACERALTLKSYSYRAVRTLIEMPVPPATTSALELGHDSVRGPEYLQ